MKPLDNIQKVLEIHGFARQPNGFLEACLGCPWVGWRHIGHLADEIAKAVTHPLIETAAELDSLVVNPDGVHGALIKCLGGVVNPTSGRYDMGEVWEKNDDGTWCMLCSPQDGYASDRAVPSSDIVLPAILLWEPTTHGL